MATYVLTTALAVALTMGCIKLSNTLSHGMTVHVVFSNHVVSLSRRYQLLYTFAPKYCNSLDHALNLFSKFAVGIKRLPRLDLQAVMRTWALTSGASCITLQDIGFNAIDPVPGLDTNVINTYFTQHFPRAAHLAEEVRRLGRRGERYTYFTQPWLISLFLDCPPGTGLQCPNKTQLHQFHDAVAR